MTLTGNHKFVPQPLFAEVDEDTSVEPGTREADSIHISDVTGMITDSSDWVYATNMEDNPNADPGILDNQQGIMYSGPSGMMIHVGIEGVDSIEHAISPPEATDQAVLCVFRNSEVMFQADEGWQAHASETAVEWNANGSFSINEGDVVRVGYCFRGEEAASDLDSDKGTLTIT